MNALAQQLQAEFARRLHYRRDRIPGGLGDKAKAQDFDREQVAKGVRVEMEHTSDPRTALEITLDHLSENPRYYDELAKLKLSRMLSDEFAHRRRVQRYSRMMQAEFARVRYAKFVEAEHPRDEDGKFSDSGTFTTSKPAALGKTAERRDSEMFSINGDIQYFPYGNNALSALSKRLNESQLWAMTHALAKEAGIDDYTRDDAEWSAKSQRSQVGGEHKKLFDGEKGIALAAFDQIAQEYADKKMPWWKANKNRFWVDSTGEVQQSQYPAQSRSAEGGVAELRLVGQEHESEASDEIARYLSVVNSAIGSKTEFKAGRYARAQ